MKVLEILVLELSILIDMVQQTYTKQNSFLLLTTLEEQWQLRATIDHGLEKIILKIIKLLPEVH